MREVRDRAGTEIPAGVPTQFPSPGFPRFPGTPPRTDRLIRFLRLGAELPRVIGEVILDSASLLSATGDGEEDDGLAPVWSIDLFVRR